MSSFLEIWLPYIYLYGAGGTLFIIGMVIIKKSGAMNLKLKRHRFWLKVLIFGIIYFMFLHFIITIAGLYW
jgi:hypothetical protein